MGMAEEDMLIVAVVTFLVLVVDYLVSSKVVLPYSLELIHNQEHKIEH